jgi:hypothetical protein
MKNGTVFHLKKFVNFLINLKIIKIIIIKNPKKLKGGRPPPWATSSTPAAKGVVGKRPKNKTKQKSLGFGVAGPPQRSHPQIGRMGWSKPPLKGLEIKNKTKKKVWVLGVADRPYRVVETKQFLSQNFEMKDLGEASYVIGIKIHRDRKQKILKLSQKAYIEKVLERFRMKNCSASVAPIIKGDKFSNDQCPRNALEQEQMENIPYAFAIDSLLYAQVCTRPDIAMSVGMLSRYQSNPGIEHWKAAKKVMRYLQGTKDYGLTFRHTDHLEVVGYSDSDFTGCVDSRKSISGYIFLLAGGAISWRSNKQTIVATSTMEAKFIECYEATTQALWLRNFVGGLKIVNSIARPIKIFCDNRVAIFFSKNNKSGSRSKYIDIKYFRVRGNIKRNEVLVEHISTELMIADPMTKGLSVKLFKSHVEHMRLIDSFCT